MNRTVLAGSIAMLINAPLLATEADSPAESDDKRLVITADYREKSLNELSSSITVLDEERLSQSGEQHLEEVLNQIANLNWAGGSSRPRYFQLRGVGELDQYEGAPNPSVGFLLDDIDLSGIGMVTTLFDTERFEVLRGPQSARFGANAIAGLINVKTRDPSEDAEIRTQFMLGTDDQWQTAVSASGALGEGVTGLLSHQRYEGNGFRDNPYLNKEDTNGRDETVTRVKFNIDINDDWQMKWTSFNADMDNGYDAFSIDNTLTTLSDKPGKDSQDTDAHALRLEYTGDAIELVSITTMADSDIEHSYDGDWGNPVSWGVNGPYDFTSETDRSRSTRSQEFRVLSTDETALNDGSMDWLVGLYLLNLEEDNDLLELYNGGVYRTLTSAYEATNMAVYSEFNQSLSETMSLTLGLRYETRDAEYMDSDGASFSPSESMWGGNLSLQVQHSDELMSWYSIARGYKAGGFNIALSVPQALREYDAEYLWNYEAGIRTSLLDNQLDIAASVFLMDREDMQVSSSTQVDPNDPLTFIYFNSNAAEGYNRGIEVDLTYRMTDDWRIEANIGYLDTEITRFEGLDNLLENREQAHAPSYHVALGLVYQNLDGWFGRLDMQARDEFYFSSSHNQKSDAYEVVNLKLGYEQTDWAVYLWVRNLFDEEYHVRGFFFANEPPDYIPALYTRQGDPVNLGVTARLWF